jgi:hypothetical protein
MKCEEAEGQGGEGPKVSVLEYGENEFHEALSNTG